jgi:hypothetical protein
MIRLSVFYPATEGAGGGGTGEVMDMANYTDIRPVLQTSEIIER